MIACSIEIQCSGTKHHFQESFPSYVLYPNKNAFFRSNLFDLKWILFLDMFHLTKNVEEMTCFCPNL